MKKNTALAFIIGIISIVSISLGGNRALGDTIKIGLSDALSGPAAAWGIPKTQAMTLQFDMINSAGGVKIGNKIYTFKYFLEDDKGTTEGGSTVALKLIHRDKIDFMLAVATTPVALSMGPICQENNILLFTDGTAGPGLSPKLTWVFRPHITGYERILAATAWLMRNKPEIKRVALYGADHEGGRFDCKTFRELIGRKAKWEIVSEDYAPVGTKDFYPLLSKLISKKPDLIFTDTAPPGDVALIIKQSRQLGYKGIIQLNTGADVPDIVKIAGLAASENVFVPNYTNDISPDMKKITDAYYAKYKEYNDGVNFVVDAVPIFIQALQGAKSTDKHAVKAYLESGASFKSYMGPDGFFYGKDIPHYGINHQFLAAVPVCRIHDGKNELLTVVSPKEILELIQK
jgi:branched-chain amino acid transport system substrate-binding protein